MTSSSKHMQLTFDDVLIKPADVSDITSRFDDKQCDPFVNRRCDSSLPVVSSPMDTIPSDEFLTATRNRIYVVFSHRFQSLWNQIDQVKHGAGAVIGLKTEREDIMLLVTAGARHLLLDVANGGNVAVIKRLEQLQDLRAKGIKLWAGNVADGTTYSALALLCDYVRVGIGNGSACTTRVNTGVGVGSVSALTACAWCRDDLARHGESPAKIVADGGIKTNGDICKELVAGADLVMLGRVFAATNESAAPWIKTPWWKLFSKPTHKLYRGMASKAINEEAGKDMSKVSIEGHQTTIRVQGSVAEVLDQIEANLRSAMSYTNSHNLEEFHEAELEQVSPSVYLEGLPHAK